MLPNVGPTELIILLTIVLLFFGAKRIPELARSLGKGTREFRKGMSEGATEDKALEQDRKEKDQKEPSPEGAASDEKPHAEAETAANKQTS